MNRQLNQFKEWKTNWNKSTIKLNEIVFVEQRDSIPAINEPNFVNVDVAKEYMSDTTPVVVVNVMDQTKAYPLDILMWHEIVNDSINGIPIAVTYCPLCSSEFVYSSKIDNTILKFEVSGLVRFSNLIMIDSNTGTLWQQLPGNAIVGDLINNKLERIPSNTVSFKEFYTTYPKGSVLSRNTGFSKDYGENPYVNYDTVTSQPLFFNGFINTRLPSMARVLGLRVNNSIKAYPYSNLKSKRIHYDKTNGLEYVIFYKENMNSALDEANINESRIIGSTGVYNPYINSDRLQFKINQQNQIVDTNTNSVWTVLGKAISGPLEGTKLSPIIHADVFWFAWSAFYPETKII